MMKYPFGSPHSFITESTIHIDFSEKIIIAFVLIIFKGNIGRGKRRLIGMLHGRHSTRCLIWTSFTHFSLSTS
jgi:hypothetical protein